MRRQFRLIAACARTAGIASRTNPHCLETSSRKTALLLSAELPHDPIARLDETLRRCVDVRRMIQGFQHLGKEPFTRIPAAIRTEEILMSACASLVDRVGFGLCRV